MKTTSVALMLALIGTNLACSGAEYDASAEGEVEDTEEALSVTDCINATETVTRQHSFHTPYLSPRTYSDPTCYKAKVLLVNDVHDFGQTRVKYADEVPTNKADCEASHVRVINFIRHNDGWALVSDETDHGEWVNPLGGSYRCFVGSVAPGLTEGGYHKLAVTARSGYGPTRKVLVDTIVVE